MLDVNRLRVIDAVARGDRARPRVSLAPGAL
jgi:hypothetical protein